MFFTEMCPSGGTRYVSFELFLSILREPGEGRRGAPGTVPLQNPEVTARKARLRNADLCPRILGTRFTNSTEQSTFQGGHRDEKVPRKRGEKGWPAKRAKRKKGRVKTGQENDMRFFPSDTGKMAIVKHFLSECHFPSIAWEKSHIAQGVENRGSLLSVP